MSSKQKKVHYERGTKGGSHGHRSSRDSGVGSSSASDRASLGQDDLPFGSQEIEDQRYRLGAVREALDAANEKIRQLEAANARLNGQLTESNKENRLLRREKTDLFHKVEDLTDDLEDAKKTIEKYRRDSPRLSPPSGRTERRTTPPRRELEPRPRREDERSQSSRSSRQPPSVPQAPLNLDVNPFLPISPISTQPAYPQTTLAYSPVALTYAPSPIYPPGSPSAGGFPNDGRYHPQSLK